MKMSESSPERVENIVGRGEIAHDEQFLLFPQCFRKTCTANQQKPGFVRERANQKSNTYHPRVSFHFYARHQTGSIQC